MSISISLPFTLEQNVVADTETSLSWDAYTLMSDASGNLTGVGGSGFINQNGVILTPTIIPEKGTVFTLNYKTSAGNSCIQTFNDFVTNIDGYIPLTLDIVPAQDKTISVEYTIEPSSFLDAPENTFIGRIVNFDYYRAASPEYEEDERIFVMDLSKCDIEKGSVTLTWANDFYSVTDDGAGGLSGNGGSGTIDYISGEVILTLSYVTSNTNFPIDFGFDARIKESWTILQKIQLSPDENNIITIRTRKNLIRDSFACIIKLFPQEIPQVSGYEEGDTFFSMFGFNTIQAQTSDPRFTQTVYMAYPNRYFRLSLYSIDGVFCVPASLLYATDVTIDTSYAPTIDYENGVVAFKASVSSPIMFTNVYRNVEVDCVTKDPITGAFSVRKITKRKMIDQIERTIITSCTAPTREEKKKMNVINEKNVYDRELEYTNNAFVQYKSVSDKNVCGGSLTLTSLTTMTKTFTQTDDGFGGWVGVPGACNTTTGEIFISAVVPSVYDDGTYSIDGGIKMDSPIIVKYMANNDSLVAHEATFNLSTLNFLF